MYGGDGRTTFALPDLRGRAPIHAGNGPGLQSIRIGDKGGQEGHYLMELNVPSSASKQTMVVRVPVSRTGDQLNIRDPYLAVNYIIALQGIYPSRN